MEEYWNYIIAAISGGGLYKLIEAIVSWFRGNRADKRDDSEAITGQYYQLLELIRSERDAKQALIDQQQSAIQVMSAQIAELEEQVRGLKSDLSTMEALHLDLPLPQWVKGKDGKVISMNKAYEEVFLEPLGKTLEDYIGNTDIDVWGKDIGQEFMDNDRETIRKRRPIHVIETIKDANGKRYYWYVFKFPIWSNRSVIGTGGIAYKRVDEEPELVPEEYLYD